MSYASEVSFRMINKSSETTRSLGRVKFMFIRDDLCNRIGEIMVFRVRGVYGTGYSLKKAEIDALPWIIQTYHDGTLLLNRRTFYSLRYWHTREDIQNVIQAKYDYVKRVGTTMVYKRKMENGLLLAEASAQSNFSDFILEKHKV